MVEQLYYGSVEISIDYTNGDDYLTVPTSLAKKLGIEARDEILLSGLGWLYVAKISSDYDGRRTITLFTSKEVRSGPRTMLRIRGFTPDDETRLESLGVGEHA